MNDHAASRGKAPPPPSDSDADLSVRVVHEGRGGFIRIDRHDYPIEHIEGGRFCIHVAAGKPSPQRTAHLAALARLVQEEAPKWQIGGRP